MPCFHPWRTDKGNVAPCGQCRGCRASYAREWAMRCMHEASMHVQNCFVTLTYDDAHLPANGSLDVSKFDSDGKMIHEGAFPRFIRSLRKRTGERIRYFHVGEYGEIRNRPHYHALLFGWSPPDKTLLSVRKGFPVFTSDLLRATWSDGLHEIGSVTAASAGYVARYIKKRMTGNWSKAKYGDREPEYGTMSRNPGIGAGWLDTYRCEVYPADSVVVRGKEVKPPRYYDLRAAKLDEALMDGVKLCRFSRRRKEEETPDRLAVREAVAIAGEDIRTFGGVL